jgi:peptide-methionine (R)-S-oxide reductase
VVLLASCANGQKKAQTPATEVSSVEKINNTEEEWKAQLTEEEFYVIREEGTERPFTSPLNNVKEEGIFYCKACELPLFSSETKFESGTGWPSFYQPLSPKYVNEVKDSSLGMVRIEVECSRCGGHLGHVFNDGPKPTGLRYCMNGVSLSFKAGDTE